jgi:hypothetical protein
MALKHLNSSAEVFDALGGIPGVMEVASAKYKAVFQWKSSGSFPSNTYVLLTGELNRRGYMAPASLWDMREPAQAAS